ncbi:hypothetical protein [Actinomadura litoris]|uniref:hypothetical protein n=1 Tax=Actinomadura litoris TaxID=2678616 RepID=UPI001FA6C81E|nr:hypothetical protein [Actinomadura litoris]
MTAPADLAKTLSELLNLVANTIHPDEDGPKRARTRAVPEPSGCRWCGLAEREHLQRWALGAGWHGWTEPTQKQRKARMLARRATNKNGAPVAPGAPPQQAVPMEGATAMRSIPRRASALHVGDVITYDPDHGRPVRWRVSDRPKVNASGVALISYADLNDGGRAGIAHFDGLVGLMVEPAGGAQ